MSEITGVGMREQMVRTLEDLLDRDERLVVLLGNISTGLFRRGWRDHTDRLYDVGILEQTMMSAAAGLAMEGLIPVAHSITPFVVERCYEQIKDDFCFQQLGGNIISTGASYDYTTEGMTHHGPGDVAILKQLPGIEIAVPGTAAEFDALFRERYADGAPTYYRLSAHQNATSQPVRFGQANVLRKGSQATVIAVGPALEPTLAAAADLDVALLYYATVAPFDAETLRAHGQSGKVALVEPYYEGTLVADVAAALVGTPTRIEAIGVPHAVLSHYGTPTQHDEAIGFTPRGIRARIANLLA